MATEEVARQTFIEAVKAGKAKLTQIDDWVELWHTGSFSMTLREFLGIPIDVYGEWMRRGDDALMGLVQQ